MTARRRRDESGAVTAEVVMTLPMLLSVTVGLVWLLAVGGAQLRAIDAARETARAIARGDERGSAIAIGERIAPTGGRVTVTRRDDRVAAVASARVAGPGGLLGFLPAVTVSARAEALMETADNALVP
ncbi:MAG: TadE family type IV pilus minor pilin [Nocardioides sp.]